MSDIYRNAHSGGDTISSQELVVCEKQSLVNIADAIREKSETTDRIGLGEMAELIAGIGAGCNMFTFTTAEVGVLKIDYDIPPTTKAAIWCRADALPIWMGEDLDQHESLAGITFFPQLTNNGIQKILTMYQKTAPSIGSQFQAACSFYISSLHNLTESSTSCYGGLCASWSSTSNIVRQISFYVNNVGAKGLRVGATYNVYFIE